jgi:hypothetical protein
MRGGLSGAILAGLLVTVATPALAQDDGGGAGEIIVTGFRKLNPDSDDEGNAIKPVTPPAAVQTLRRTADFAVQQVVIVSDTVGEEKAREEVLAMTRKAIELSARAGTLLATGELVVEPLTLGNHKELVFIDDDDEFDGELVKILVKVPLAPGIDAKAALARIERFMKAVPAVGRAEIKPYSELTLSVVNPEQYRGAIIDLVARDTAATSGRFGTGYGVEVTGLDRPVQWKRAGLTEVQLFLPSASTVRPRN